MTTPVLSAERLSKRIGQQPVLTDVSFELGEGCAIAFLGPNGAGKTTLLKVIAGLWSPSGGTLERFGSPAVLGRADPRVAFVGHHSFLYGSLTARENLIFQARLWGASNPGRDADEELFRVGLTWSRNDPVKTFSRGMVQRLAIARALIAKPRLLLMDEPYTGLDFAAQADLTTILDEFTDDGGAVVLITHRPEEAIRIADAVLILLGGRIAWWARSDALTAESLADEYGGRLGEGGGRHS